MCAVANEQGERYVVSGAMIQCNQGSSSGNLQLSNSHKFSINGKYVLNVGDNQSMANIGSMGMCKITKGPCVPNASMKWQQGAETVCVDNNPALLSTSVVVCAIGGAIKIVDDGQ